MNIGFLGTNHNETSLEEMESVYVPRRDHESFISSVLDSGVVSELVVLSTCNRMEFYFVADSLDIGLSHLVSKVAEYKGVEDQDVRRYMKHLLGRDAILQLFRVSSGIESMVFGENEILTQVKLAYDRSKEWKYTSAYLNKVFQTAVAAGKRVRSETGIAQGSYSVSSIAVDAIRELLLDYFGRRILIVGVGTMGRRAVKKLAALGHPDITVTNRTFSKSQSFAEEEGVQALPIEEALERFCEFDIVISAVARKSFIPSSVFASKGALTLVIDLGVPRNVDTQDVDLGEVQVLTVEGLKDIADKNIRKRKAQLGAVLGIIEDELVRMEKWYSHKVMAR